MLLLHKRILDHQLHNGLNINSATKIRAGLVKKKKYTR